MSDKKRCKFCKKEVKDSFDCEVCLSSYHKSCGIQGRAINKEGKVICCESEVKLPDTLDKRTMDEKQMKTLLEKTFAHHFVPFKNTVERELSELKKSMQFLSDSFEDQKTQFKKTLEEVKQLKDENNRLNEKVVIMEEKLNQIEQREKEKNMVVSGIPKQNEELAETMKKVFEALKVPIKDGDVQEIYRLNNTKEDAPILLKLKTTLIKSELMAKIRESKGLKLNECSLSGGRGSIYFNEDLTRQNQLLFKKVREIRKEKKYYRAYVSNGKVYLRKGESDRPVRIRSELDLE